MVWGKELTKDDLVKAGLNPDDLAELKANGVKKADLDTLKTEISTSMTELIKNQFTELETKLRPVNNNNNNNDNNNNNNNNNDNKPDEQTDFLTDPVGFTNKKVAQSIAYSAVQTTKMRMDMAMDRGKATLRGFKNQALTDEIMTEWAQYKPENFAMQKDFDPDKLLLKIHNMVMGNHIDDINRDTDKKEGKFNMVASGGGGGGGNQHHEDHSNKNPVDLMTDFEKKQAARYGMTNEEWVASDKEMADEITMNESVVSKSLKDKVKAMQTAGV